MTVKLSAPKLMLAAAIMALALTTYGLLSAFGNHVSNSITVDTPTSGYTDYSSSTPDHELQQLIKARDLQDSYGSK